MPKHFNLLEIGEQWDGELELFVDFSFRLRSTTALQTGRLDVCPLSL